MMNENAAQALRPPIGGGCEVAPKQPTLKDVVASQVQDAEKRLAELRELEELLEKNPDLERAMTLLRSGVAW